MKTLTRRVEQSSPPHSVNSTNCTHPRYILTARGYTAFPCQSANPDYCLPCAETWRYARIWLETEAVSRAVAAGSVAVAFTLTAAPMWRKGREDVQRWNDRSYSLFTNAVKRLRRRVAAVEYVISREVSQDGTKHYHGTLTVSAPGMGVEEVLELVEQIFREVRTGAGDGWRRLSFGEVVVKEVSTREDAERWARYHNKRPGVSAPLALGSGISRGAWGRSRGLSAVTLKQARRIMISQHFARLE